MTALTFLGGAREVGRLSVLLEGSERFLLDYGYEVQDGTVPIQPRLPLDGVFVSHAHIDHSGQVPELYKRGYNGSVYATPATFDLIGMLLRDSIKVQEKQGKEPHFLREHIRMMEGKRHELNFGKPVRIGSSSVTLRSAGHIPGSAMTLIETQGKRILFTGDVKLSDTALMDKAFTAYKDIDILITETTYSYKNHPPRDKLIDRLREISQETIYQNGILVLPAFAVGRTQELLLVTYDLGFEVWLDGMGIDATNRILSHPESFRDEKTLRKAFSRAHKVRGPADRKKAIQKPGIIITTAGMMNGGPVGYYMKHLHSREDCFLLLTGFQVPGTVGRKLVDTGRYIAEGLDVKPRMGMEMLDLSAHCGRDNLIRFIKKISPKKTFLVHGEFTEDFAKELNGMGLDVAAPENGDRVEL
jgi:putative mRNA 3-end processing factor